MASKVQWAIAFFLCSPSLIATVTLAVLSRGGDASAPRGGLRSIVEGSAPWLFVAAAYGPILLVGAVLLVIKLGKAPGSHASVVGAAWVAVLLAAGAAIYFHGALIWRLQLP
jgi:hypothetical protein